MRLWPRSLFGRLLGIAMLTTIVALAFAAFAIGHVLERFVTRGMDQQLDTQLGILAAAVRPDGSLDADRSVSLPAFADSGSGWGWRVDGTKGHWAAGAAFDADARSRHGHPSGWPDDRPLPETGPMPGEGRAATGDRVHVRQLSVPTGAGPVLLTAAGPRRVAVAPLREATVPLLLSLALLGGGLAVATLLQVRFGLHPLRQLRRDLAEVRAGHRRHIPADQPVEIAPLAIELNALIDQNEQALAHARRHVANLAHGLKTPLAALSVRLSEADRDPDGSLGEMIGRIDRRIRHHLGRARAAAPGGTPREPVPIAPAVADLLGALGRIHAERTITVDVAIPPDLAAAIDPQDLDELIGNVLDNAWRHARSAIRVAGSTDGTLVKLTIEDDGPGLPGSAIADAFVPGRRLDEAGDGHGFGLPIALELAEMNGGGLSLAASTLGGLKAVLFLKSGLMQSGS